MNIGMGQHFPYWPIVLTVLPNTNRGGYSWLAPSNTFSPARIATVSRFSFGGIGQLQLAL